MGSKLRILDHPNFRVPFGGGNKDTPHIGSNDTKISNEAEKIKASSKEKGIAEEKSGSKEATGDTTEQLEAAQLDLHHPQVPSMAPFDPKDHGAALRHQYIMYNAFKKQ